MKRKKPCFLGWTSGGDCLHCGRPVRQLYMLNDTVWSIAAGDCRLLWARNKVANLHIGCVEKRIGRRLRARDFYYQDARVRR